MPPQQRRVIVSGLAAAAALALISLGCKDSNSVSGPTAAMSPPAQNVTGTWTGTFHPGSTSCASSSASATFKQNGSYITGTLTTASCGLDGWFKGVMDGNSVTGSFAMNGCTGGATSGTISPSGLSLTIGDLSKPLVRGGVDVMPGGIVTLHR